MTDLWVPGVEHQPIAGAGLSVSAGRPKVVLHTTETDPGSIDFLINHWRTNWGSGLPHFIVEGSRIVQLLALNVGAYTLENAPGGADTNRSGPAVQAEVVSRAANDWDDATYEAVGKMLGLVKKAGHDFDLGTYPRFYGANEGIVLASYSSPIRMTAQQYIDFNGWTDHAHCPENAHWDIGKKDGKRIEAIARRWAGAPANQPNTPPPAPEEDIMATKAELEQVVAAQADRIIAAIPKPVAVDDGRWMATFAAEGKIYAVINGVRYHVPGGATEEETNHRLALLELQGFDNRGVQDAALSVLPEAPFSIVAS